MANYPIQTEATDLDQANKARRAGWKVDYPKCQHQWEEMDTDEDATGEPPYDQCIHCGEVRR